MRAAIEPWREPVLVVLGLAAAGGVLARRHAVPAGQRHGLGWLAVGTLLLSLALLPLALDSVLPLSVPVSFAPLVLLCAQAFIPASVLVVLLGHRLRDLEPTVRRTPVWALTTGIAIEPSRGEWRELAVRFAVVHQAGTAPEGLPPAFGYGGAERVDLVDVDGTISAWLRRHRVEAVVLRPDRFVYGVVAAGGTGGAGRALAAALGTPQASTRPPVPARGAGLTGG
ncbi:hypothetical protein ACH4OY_11370 [Micromonospora rubida]|uniref:Uncharacterized protein n=1 Tax=Micromonospora rubida TaxID=2697657 RepID=A0ABW7SK58_9ACTN